MALPLTRLTRKDVKFEWGDAQVKAFDKLRTALITDPVLVYPDFSKDFVLITDSSQFAMGAVLAQLVDGEERPIAYASRQLKQAESNYSCIERELNAVVWGIKTFNCFLNGRPFRVYCDHKPIQWLMGLKNPSSRQTHWSILLSEYDFEVVYRPGAQIPHADALSRIKIGAN